MFHGDLNLIGRDAQLDARNAFAPAKPPERKHIIEGVFGGRWAAATRQISASTTISIRPSYEYESNSNRGVGIVCQTCAGGARTSTEGTRSGQASRSRP